MRNAHSREDRWLFQFLTNRIYSIIWTQPTFILLKEFKIKRTFIFLFLLLASCAPALNSFIADNNGQQQSSVPSGSAYYEKGISDNYGSANISIPILSDENILPNSSFNNSSYQYANKGLGLGAVYGHWYKNYPWLGSRAHLFFTESEYYKNACVAGVQCFGNPYFKNYSWYGSFSLDVLDLRYTGFGQWGYPYFFLGTSY